MDVETVQAVIAEMRRLRRWDRQISDWADDIDAALHTEPSIQVKDYRTPEHEQMVFREPSAPPVRNDHETMGLSENLIVVPAHELPAHDGPFTDRADENQYLFHVESAEAAKNAPPSAPGGALVSALQAVGIELIAEDVPQPDGTVDHYGCHWEVDSRTDCSAQAPTWEEALRDTLQCAAALIIHGDIRSVSAPGGAALRDWQPIETAPKDGTQVWLWWDGTRRLAHWHEAVNPPSIGGRFANWLTDDKGSVSAVTKPTLWHPLPLPPLAADRSTDGL